MRRIACGPSLTALEMVLSSRGAKAAQRRRAAGSGQQENDGKLQVRHLSLDRVRSSEYDFSSGICLESSL